MLEIKLNTYGVEDILKDIQEDLESVVSKRVSNRKKDAVINKAIGSLDAVWRLIHVVETVSDRTLEEMSDD